MLRPIICVCVFAFDQCMYIHTKHCLIQPHTHTHSHTHFLFLSFSSLRSTVATTQTIQIILTQTVWSHPCTHTHTFQSSHPSLTHTHCHLSTPHTNLLVHTQTQTYSSFPSVHCASSPLHFPFSTAPLCSVMTQCFGVTQ